MRPLRWAWPEAYRMWRQQADAAGLKLGDWRAFAEEVDHRHWRVVIVSGFRRWTATFLAAQFETPGSDGDSNLQAFFARTASDMAEALASDYRQFIEVQDV
jgi:hypothetical protein